MRWISCHLSYFLNKYLLNLKMSKLAHLRKLKDINVDMLNILATAMQVI